MNARFLFLILANLVALSASAHKGHTHPAAPVPESAKTDALKLKLSEINEAYKSEVKSIFQRSCFDCHGSADSLPWYHGVPGVTGLIDGDINEAKEHLDFSKDFPFGGHGNPKEDLEAISESVRKDEMPPFRYRVMHWNSRLGDEEKKAVLKWADDGLKLLDEGNP